MIYLFRMWDIDLFLNLANKILITDNETSFRNVIVFVTIKPYKLPGDFNVKIYSVTGLNADLTCNMLIYKIRLWPYDQ